ncbi:hypothetical protein Trydic_g16424 [Trypoxylus dichotomus]
MENTRLNISDAERYWSGLWGASAPTDSTNTILEEFRTHCEKRLGEKNTQIREITELDIRRSLVGNFNFSVPGPDGINSYWWKKFKATHVHLARIINMFLRDPTQIPDRLCEGRTILVYKKGDTVAPQNYRPITCLNSIYKIFTSIVRELIIGDVDPVWSETTEQRGARSGLAGVKENLLIEATICQDAILYKRNLSMAWIDMAKA